jgi:hypothetical protein
MSGMRGEKIVYLGREASQRYEQFFILVFARARAGVIAAPLEYYDELYGLLPTTREKACS